MPKAIQLVDSFGDNATDTAKWNTFGVIQEVNQRLEIRPLSNTTNSYGGYVSASSYDLTSSQVSVELVRALRAVDGAEAYLHVKNTAGDHLFLKVQQGLFYASKQLATATSSTHLAEEAYDPRRHRWLRI